MVDIDALVPQEHLLRKIEKVMDYEWLMVLDVEVTAGNVHDSIAWDAVYDRVRAKYDVEFAVMQ